MTGRTGILKVAL